MVLPIQVILLKRISQSGKILNSQTQGLQFDKQHLFAKRKLNKTS